ncbi:MAG TPA: DUF1800 domain-containing protein [Candidatus Acidoferrales bacterium]|nr:DUF1800 domain-containing protein [Candidatus Acidoferrales bacterium]
MSLVALTCFLVGCAGGGASQTSTGSTTTTPQASVTVSATTNTVTAGGSIQFTAAASGATSPAFVWSVNGTSGGNSTVGTISTSGTGSTATYAAPSSVPSPATVTIQAALSSNPAVSGTMTATITSAGLSANVADRFLEQATFGPTNALIAQVQQTGLQNFLSAQLTMAVTPYADPAATETNNTLLQQRYFVQQITAPDQLRQRVAFALAQIFVIAGDKINTPQGFTPYLNLLENDAFANYRQIMQDVTLSPAMGHYLDMVNNDKPNATTGTHADENYAREAMQLFTIGLSMLNEDGSLQVSNGTPIPTYTQDTVEAFARAYTGWTYPTQPGAALQKHNPAYWSGPMVAFESNHDTDPKQLLQYSGASSGGLLAGGQTAEQDLAGALDNIFNHPNVPPFVALRLIQHLVSSNPSPAYIQRVADVFKNNGSGVRGDMTAVITAVLMDPEARRGDNPATAVGTDGHLQEPILYMTGLLREFNATTDGANLAGQGGNMGQTALYPASVFNFYSPFFKTSSGHPAPEFQLLTTATALSRANWVNSLAFGSLGATTTIDFSPWGTQAANLSSLLDSLNTLMLHGTMSTDMRNNIMTALQAVPAGSAQALTQAKTAIYLIATSSQYQVQN